jgi:isopentenyl-diphosphate delta-isomerase
MTLAAHAADTSRDDVVLVDDDDRAIGTMPKLEAHRLGRRHRAVSVIVRDGSGRLLLQQRAASKYHSAGLWTNTCCSHPRPEEAAHAAAARRLAEEMGIAAALGPLFIMQYRARVPGGLTEHELVHVFGGTSQDTPRPDPGEVAAWRWVAFDELVRDVQARPQAYTVWFRQFLAKFGPALAHFSRG